MMGERGEPHSYRQSPQPQGENYSLLIIGDSMVGGDGGEVDGDGRGGNIVDGDGSGGTSPSQKVPEQRLLSPKICLRWRRHCRTVQGETPIILGFSVPRLLIGKKAASEVG
jgi:hypothetical protein